MFFFKRKSEKKLINEENPGTIINSECLIVELKRSIKDLNKKDMGERKMNGIGFSKDNALLATGLSIEYEIPPKERMELEEYTAETSPKEHLRILSLFRQLLVFEENPAKLPQLLKSCILRVIEERSKKEKFSYRLNKTVANLKKISPSCKITPLNY
ncbi:unnamed protein product [Dimorphilus gyrociliatus]|uniref:Uncharacterized protein n=1 Tax=Dimorphilus gyrociliatus TaxID=2664684 RepID=A0A7I8VSZ0_9ANNE|nr:unnamed protein product [Dimorphilus gyrociliatus]